MYIQDTSNVGKSFGSIYSLKMYGHELYKFLEVLYLMKTENVYDVMVYNY